MHLETSESVFETQSANVSTGFVRMERCLRAIRQVVQLSCGYRSGLVDAASESHSEYLAPKHTADDAYQLLEDVCRAVAE